MEQIDKVKAIAISDGYCHYTDIPKELKKLPTIKAIPVEVLQEIVREIEQLRQPTIPHLINYAAVFNEGINTALNIIDAKIAEYTDKGD